MIWLVPATGRCNSEIIKKNKLSGRWQQRVAASNCLCLDLVRGNRHLSASAGGPRLFYHYNKILFFKNERVILPYNKFFFLSNYILFSHSLIILKKFTLFYQKKTPTNIIFKNKNKKFDAQAYSSLLQHFNYLNHWFSVESTLVEAFFELHCFFFSQFTILIKY